MTPKEVREMLLEQKQKKIGRKRLLKVSLVGIGMDGAKTLSKSKPKTGLQAPIFWMGAKRMLAPFFSSEESNLCVLEGRGRFPPICNQTRWNVLWYYCPVTPDFTVVLPSCCHALADCTDR